MLCKILENMFLGVITLLITPIFFFGLFILFVPCFVYRSLILLASKLIRWDLKCMLTPYSNFLANDDFNHPTYPILTVSVVKGNLDAEEEKKFIDNFFSENFPSAKCLVEKWKGFHFLKVDNQFDISNHVEELYVGETVDEFKLEKIKSEMFQKKFPKDRSPWSITIINNFQNGLPDGPYSIILMRIHHCLSDGLSLLKIGYKLVQQTKEMDQKVDMYFRRLDFFKKLLLAIHVLLLSPFHFIFHALSSLKSNGWIKAHKNLSGTFVISKCQHVSLEAMKASKNTLGVTFTTQTLACYAGAIRKLMIEQKLKLPEEIAAVIPISIPGHSKKTTNYFGLAPLSLPIAEEDSMTRLQLIERDIKSKKQTPLVFFTFILCAVNGCLPVFLYRFLLRFSYVTSGLSTLPGPEGKPIIIRGHELIDYYFLVGFGDHLGVGASHMTFGEKVYFNVIADTAVFKDNSQCDLLAKYFVEEAEFFQRKSFSIV